MDAWRDGAAAAVDVYEAAVGTAVATQHEAACGLPLAPLRAVIALCADLTRDVAALQASAVRWALDR
jgi:hypothetical protein